MIKDVLNARKRAETNPTVVVDAHTSFLVKKPELDPPRTRWVVHPSEVSKEHFCPREFAIKELNPELKRLNIGAQLQGIFDVGNAVHAFLQDDFARMGVLYGTYACTDCKATYLGFREDRCPSCQKKDTLRYEEVQVRNDEHLVHGHTDGIWYDAKTNKKYVLEIKTISDYGFTQVEWLNNDARADHKMQALIYATSLPTRTSERIAKLMNQQGSFSLHNHPSALRRIEELPFEGVVVLYYLKHSSQRHERVVPMSPENRALVQARYDALRPAVDWLREVRLRMDLNNPTTVPLPECPHGPKCACHALEKKGK